MRQCEDYPCCGHEANDCDGSLYGSDQSIWEREWRRFYYDEEYFY